MHEVARERAANPALDLSATIHAVAARAQSLPAVAANCDPKESIERHHDQWSPDGDDYDAPRIAAILSYCEYISQ